MPVPVLISAYNACTHQCVYLHSSMPVPASSNACTCICQCLCLYSTILAPVVYSPMPAPVLTNVCTCNHQCLYLYSPVPVPVLANAGDCTHQCLCLGKRQCVCLYPPIPVPVLTSACTCTHQCLYLCDNRAALETDLQIEREWRSTLQKTLEHEKEKVAQMHMELQQMVEIKRVSSEGQDRSSEYGIESMTDSVSIVINITGPVSML